MGTIFQANCSCGFKQIDLLQGYGIRDRGIGYELYQCEDCHMLASYELRQQVDSLFKPVRCPDCQGAMRRLSGVLENRQLSCPECREPSLALSVTTLWD